MAPSSTLKLCAAVPMPIENFPECHRERTRFSGEFSAAGRVFRANKAKQKHTKILWQPEVCESSRVVGVFN